MAPTRSSKPDKLFLGKELLYCATPEREREMTMAYRHKGVTYLKRFTFGGTILNKDYRLCPEKSKSCSLNPVLPKCFTSSIRQRHGKLVNRRQIRVNWESNQPRPRATRCPSRSTLYSHQAAQELGCQGCHNRITVSLSSDGSGSPVDEAPRFHLQVEVQLAARLRWSKAT